MLPFWSISLMTDDISLDAIAALLGEGQKKPPVIDTEFSGEKDAPLPPERTDEASSTTTEAEKPVEEAVKVEEVPLTPPPQAAYLDPITEEYRITQMNRIGFDLWKKPRTADEVLPEITHYTQLIERS